MNPHDYCRQRAAASGSSFYYSFMFLPQERREAITALYAFCREVDDVVDYASDANLAHTQLAWWRHEIDLVFTGTPTHPAAIALKESCVRFDLPREPLVEIIDGMAMDLEQNRYADFTALETYCHRVAGVVGMLAARIFGFENPATLDYAHELGLAFQLTNIIRDVGEDARIGRIYLPLEDLQRFDVPIADILGTRYSANFRNLMQFQFERAESCYEQALARLPPVDRRAQRAGLIMAKIYRTLLREIARNNFRVLDRRTSLTPLRKVWLAGLTWFKAR